MPVFDATGSTPTITELTPGGNMYETSFYLDSHGTTFNGNAVVPIMWNKIGFELSNDGIPRFPVTIDYGKGQRDD